MHFSLTHKYDALWGAVQTIPEDTTSLDLSSNNLAAKTPQQLKQIFSYIRQNCQNLVSLDLGCNNLGHLKGEALTSFILLIPKHIPSISLRDNYLSDRTADELGDALFHLSLTVESLDLSWNTLVKKSSDDLTYILSKIHGSVRFIDLSFNSLGIYRGLQLPQALDVLSAGVTVNLSKNNLFKNKSCDQKEALVLRLNEVNTKIRLDFSNDEYDSDVQRAMAPLASFAKKPVNKRGDSVPMDVLVRTLSFLLPENKHVASRLDKKVLDAVSIVSEKESINDFTPIGFVSESNFGHK